MIPTYLEIPDKNLKIQKPSPEDISRELSAIKYSSNQDNCLDLYSEDKEFVQAIGCAKGGFLIRFCNKTGKVIQTVESNSLKKTERVLKSYLLSGSFPVGSLTMEKVEISIHVKWGYREWLYFQAIFILIAGLTLPGFADRRHYSLIEFLSGIFEVEPADFVIFLSPFFVHAIFLLVVTLMQPKNGKITAERFWGQFGGGCAIFLPYYVVVFRNLAGGNAPQSLFVLVLPLSVIFTLPILYGIGYFIGSAVSKISSKR